MAGLLENIRLVIFDLDGTLYEDTAHFDYFAGLVAALLPPERQQAFMDDYRAAAGGRHALAIGRVYDAGRDLVLALDRGRRVRRAWTWAGRALAAAEIAALYPQPVELTFMGSIINVGDGWWLPHACARHHGLPDTGDAYFRTKEWMGSDAFHFTPIPGLRQALLRARSGRRLVVATNSQPDDVARILERTGLTDLFHEIRTGCQKPARTAAVFTDILQRAGVAPAEALSVGDNYLNDIVPAEEMGMATVFIDPHGGDYPDYGGRRVQSIRDILKEF